MDNQLKIQIQQSIRCPACGSVFLKIICGQDERTSHWGRLECGDCGRWVKWLPKPKPQPDLKRCEFIGGLLQSGKLTSWERSFLGSIRDKPGLSQKQLRVFERISKKITGSVYQDTS